MTVITVERRQPDQRHGRSGLPRAGTLASACLHVVALAALMGLVLPRLAPPRPQLSFPMVFLPASPGPAARTAPAAPAVAHPPAPSAPVLPKVPPVASRMAAPARRIHPPQPAPAAHAADAAGTSAAAPRQAATAGPAAAARPAPSRPPDVAADPGWASFTADVQAAVQAASVYPPVARVRRVQGRVRVSFDYADGHAGAPSVLVSSQAAVLDRAALRAVRTASYPAPPPALGHEHRQLVVWVDFRMSLEE